MENGDTDGQQRIDEKEKENYVYALSSLNDERKNAIQPFSLDKPY